MQAEIYLVFNQHDELIQTRVITQHEVVYRSVHRATEFAEKSRTYKDIGSIVWCTVESTDVKVSLLRYDRYIRYRTIKVAEIDI